MYLATDETRMKHGLEENSKHQSLELDFVAAEVDQEADLDAGGL
jgi:hypothetical protein